MRGSVTVKYPVKRGTPYLDSYQGDTTTTALAV